MSHRINLAGQKFGLWEVKQLSGYQPAPHRATYWDSLCTGCDHIFPVRLDHLRGNNSKACRKCAPKYHKQIKAQQKEAQIAYLRAIEQNFETTKRKAS